MSEVLRHGVPMPLEWEAPSGWLGRLSLAQGCRVVEVKHFLGLAARGVRDVDSAFVGDIASVVRYRCGLPPTAFRRVEVALQSMDVQWLRHAGWPRFRYCPLCLSERQTPYFDIYWRFLHFGVCLVHGCDLQLRCPGCQGQISAPSDVFKSAAGRAGCASQNHCQRCSWDLARAPAMPSRHGLPLAEDLEARLLEPQAPVPKEPSARARNRVKVPDSWPWLAER